MAYQPDEAVEVLRAVWAADGQRSEDLDEACGPTKSCRNMKDVTFDGMAEPGTDLRRRLAGAAPAGGQARHRPAAASATSCWVPRRH